MIGAPAAAQPLQTSESIRAARIVANFGTITSMYRTVAHNHAVGGVADSYHLLGRAIDVVRRPGITHRQIDIALRAAGFSLIESLDEHNHSHFAFAPVPAPPAVVRTEPVPVQPSDPPPPRLLADVHGTLWTDLKPAAPIKTEPKAVQQAYPNK